METFLFQTIPLFVFDDRRFGHKKIKIYPIFISAFIFGLAHYFNYNPSLAKFVSTFLIGLVLAYAYWLYKYYKTRPF